MAVTSCNLPLVSDLNDEGLRKADTQKGSKMNLRIDDKPFSLTDKARKYFRSMDVRILQFLIEEKKKCSR